MLQAWEELLEVIRAFYVLNPGAGLQEVREHIRAEPIIANEELEFRHARQVDDALFGENENTHWAQAFSFPQENTTVIVAGVPCTATRVGIFTFLPQPQL